MHIRAAPSPRALLDEVREKRGLAAYGVDSSPVTHEYSSGLVISTATRSDRAAETLAVIRETVRQDGGRGPTEAELAAAKKYVIGSLARWNNLDSSNAIARDAALAAGGDGWASTGIHGARRSSRPSRLIR